MSDGVLDQVDEQLDQQLAIAVDSAGVGIRDFDDEFVARVVRHRTIDIGNFS